MVNKLSNTLNSLNSCLSMLLIATGGATSPFGGHTLAPAKTVQKTQKAQTTQNYATSTLSGFKARKIFFGFLEGVQCRGFHCCTIGTPFLVFFLALRPPCCARRISG